MKTFILSLVTTGAFLGLTALAAPALADVPPPNSCLSSEVGQSCTTDGGVQGLCTQETCNKVNPADGGTISYTCYLCEGASGTGGAAGASAGGSAGATATGGSAGAMATGGAPSGTGGTSSKSSSSSSSSGCSLAAPEQGGAVAGLMFLVGLGALALGRRRRR
jgi:MYXO-CTERM domain-containing protein